MCSLYPLDTLVSVSVEIDDVNAFSFEELPPMLEQLHELPRPTKSFIGVQDDFLCFITGRLPELTLFLVCDHNCQGIIDVVPFLGIRYSICGVGDFFHKIRLARVSPRDFSVTSGCAVSVPLLSALKKCPVDDYFGHSASLTALVVREFLEKLACLQMKKMAALNLEARKEKMSKALEAEGKIEEFRREIEASKEYTQHYGDRLMARWQQEDAYLTNLEIQLKKSDRQAQLNDLEKKCEERVKVFQTRLKLLETRKSSLGLLPKLKETEECRWAFQLADPDGTGCIRSPFIRQHLLGVAGVDTLFDVGVVLNQLGKRQSLQIGKESTVPYVSR